MTHIETDGLELGVESADTLETKTARNEGAQDHARHHAEAVCPERVERAAADLYADFQRQGGKLSQAQFDRLVLRRNLCPAEMIAVLAKLSSLGVALNEAVAPAADQTEPVLTQNSVSYTYNFTQ